MFAQLIRLFKHSIVYGLGAAASQILSFFLIPMYTRFLNPADYGILEIFTATTSVLYVFAYLGLGVALLRFYPENDNEEKRKELLSTVVISITAISFVLSAVCIAFAQKLSMLIFGSILYATHFRVIFLTMFFDVGVYIALTAFRAKQKSVNYVAVTIARIVLVTGLNIFFLGVLHRGVLGILEASLVTLTLLYLILMIGLIKEINPRLSITKLKQMLLFGLPYVPSSIAHWVLALSDRYFLQIFSTSQELGLYSLGYKFGVIISSLLVGPFTLVWQPFVASIVNDKKAKQIYASVFTYFILIAVFIVLVLSLLSKEAIAIMATAPFHDAYEVVPLIALSYLAQGCYFVFEAGVFLAKKTKYVPVVIGMAAIVKFGLNYLLIPRYGMMGAATATLISFAIMPVAMFFISKKFYPISYEFGRVAKIFVVAVPIYIGGILIKNNSLVIEVLLRMTILAIYPILLYFFKFYKPQELTKVKEICMRILGLIRVWGSKHQ